jgi:hypothetical protein
MVASELTTDGPDFSLENIPTMTSSLLPSLEGLTYAVTAIAVDSADWTTVLCEAGKRAQNGLDTGLALERKGQCMLVCGNGTVNLGSCSADDVGDLVACFDFLLLDGRMFDDLAAALRALSKLARLHSCRVVVMISRDRFHEMEDAICYLETPVGSLH